MSKVYKYSTSYDGRVEHFRNVMRSLQFEGSGWWESPSGERLHLMEWLPSAPAVNREHLLCRWYVRVREESAETVGKASIEAVELPGQRIQLKFLDGRDVRNREPSTPIGVAFEQLTQEILKCLAEPQAQTAAKEKREGPKLGLQGGTLERARSARELIEQGETKTKACKRAHIDPRTYDRYAADIIDWEGDPYEY